MGSIIRSTGTVFYSLFHLNSTHGFNGLKYMFSVISVIVYSLLGNTKNRESTRSWTARVRLVHSWTEDAPFIWDMSDASFICDMSYMNKACLIWGMSNMNKACRIWIRHVKYETCLIWGMSNMNQACRIWMRHVEYETCLIWGMSNMNKACRKWMRHVEYETCLIWLEHILDDRYETWLIHMRDMTHSYERHGSFIWQTWLI